MLTVGSDKRANIADICSHWWINEGYSENSCLQEAEYLAGLTPVRLDLLLSLAPPGSAMGDAIKESVLVEPNEDDQQVRYHTNLAPYLEVLFIKSQCLGAITSTII